MIDLFGELTGIAAVILCVWTAALLIMSLQLRHVARQLDSERRSLRTWRRLSSLHDKQKDKWN